METTAEDFQPGGVFAPGGGGVVTRLDEWEVGPDGWLVHHPPEDLPPVELGLEYEPTRAGVGSSAPLLNYLAIGAIGLALLLSRKR